MLCLQAHDTLRGAIPAAARRGRPGQRKGPRDVLPDTSLGNADVSLGPARLRCPDCDPVIVARPLRYGSRLVLYPAHSPPEQLPAPRGR